VVKSKGAFLHNVMPLIAEPEHGTFYGLMGQASPTAEELQKLQDACSGDMNMMRHCRQCRADAVGLLGEDRGQEFTMDKIEDMEIDYPAAMVKRAEVHAQIAKELEEKDNKARAAKAELVSIQSLKPDAPVTRPVLMAVSTKGGGVINEHFGHAHEFLVYEASGNGVRFIGHRKTTAFCEGGSSCGDGESALDETLRVLKGCEVVLSAKIGFEPWAPLEAAGIQPNGEHAMEPIEEAIAAVYAEMIAAGKLDAQAVQQQKVA
jgi:nitrogen fixation protein NifB